MPPVADPRAALVAELAEPEAAVDLARAALLIAAEEYPGLDVDAYIGKIDDLAVGVRPRLSGDEGPACSPRSTGTSTASSASTGTARRTTTRATPT